MRALRIGTRGSALALWQARTVARLLEAAGRRIEIITIRTSGDDASAAANAASAPALGDQAGPDTTARIADVLGRQGLTPGKALFVKEIEDALRRGEIDVAVHSAKDLSAVLPHGLDIAAVLPREDPLDALVLPARANFTGIDAVLAHLGDSPVIGTSSVRRAAQLSAVLPGAAFLPVRGNVDTRLRKLDDGQFAAIVLAAAGLRRLGLAARISATIPIDRCVPAPGQGIVAIEIRADDGDARGALAAANDRAAAVSLDAERAVVSALGGGCQLPLGAIALHDSGELHMHAVVVAPDGCRIVRREARGPASDPARLGAMLAEDLARGGAMEILDEVRRGAEGAAR